MKKIISLFLTIVLALSCSITSLAATNDQADDMELEIRQAICEQLLSDYEDIAPYDFPMMIVGTTSDGFTCFTYSYLGHPDVVVDEYFGDYKYSYNAGIEFFCYRDGIIYKIKDAYENGVINDNTIADIANMGVDITKVESPTTPTVTEPEEPTENTTENTQPVTETEENTQTTASTVVNTTAPTENGATDDEAVTQTTANGNNSATPATVNGDAVKTGEPLTAVSILAALIIACAASALILKRKQNI